MSRASRWAMAVMALGAPRRERRRRNLAPSALWLRSRPQAARRKAVEARFTTCRVPRFSTLPPADPIVRAQAEPGGELLLALPPAHVHPNFGNHRLRRLHVHAIDLRQIQLNNSFRPAEEIRVL